VGIDDAPVGAGARFDASTDDFFIPDFCAPRMVFAVVLIAELLAVTLTLARPEASFLTMLAGISMFLQWLGLTSAALLCYARPLLARLTIAQSSIAVFALLLANTTVISALAAWFGSGLATDFALPTAEWPFLLRNLGICVIVTALLLRYFFVTHMWQKHVRAEARSRIEALQARIRPHFLFNSMNTIAALTRSDPARAEEAVEDLADLFRATLRDSHSPLRLKEELELTRIYQRIEALRLGDRLRVTWNVAALPMRAFVPGLTIQPLLENAIYHGIEPLENGGTVTVTGRVVGGEIEIVVANPVAEERAGGGNERTGNRLALDNIRQRLALAYSGRGVLEVEKSAGQYQVTVRFPFTE
jgi:two-component system sensor histidine kinase AlgZ